MRRILLALSASLVTLAFSLPALADDANEAAKEPATTTETKPTEAAPTAKSIEENNQGFLGKGAIIFGAERVFGFSVTSFKQADRSSTSVTQYGVLWSQPNSVFTTPRMAFDYVAFDQVTFGGAVAVAHTSADGGGATSFIAAPRAGYIFGGRGVLSLWLRAGLTVWSEPTAFTSSSWGCAFDVEPELIISPYKHLGIYIGGVLDLGLFGHYDANFAGTPESGGFTVSNYGATGGLRAWF